MLLAVASIPVHGQDLLARQAPVDRKMAAVDTIMLRNIAAREEAESPATDLYAGWDNRYAHRATELPEHYKIDLRHFCMPTTSRVITSNFGSRWGRQHKGLDIKVYIGDTIRAAFSGKVRIVDTRAEDTVSISSSDITTVWRLSTDTSRSSSWMRTRRFAPVMLSVSVVTLDEARVRTFTSRHVSAAWLSIPLLCSTSVSRT